MSLTDTEELHKKLYKRLALLSYKELAELKISGQNAVKIKNGRPCVFYAKTFARLRHLVE